MIFKIHQPQSLLKDFVDNIVYHEGYSPGHSISRFLPDGNTELIIDLTTETKYIYDNQTLLEKQSCNKAWVSGLRTSYISIPSGKQSRMLVISFRKGKAQPFYKIPVSAISDTVVDADLILGRSIFELREKLFECRSVYKMFLLIEEYLLEIAGDRLNFSVPSSCIDFAIKNIVKSPGILTLNQLSNQIGYSQKHFIHLFTKLVGVSPKIYLRIIRFQKAIAEIENMQIPDWISVAIECGFYDQAHYNNEFRRLSGFTPKEYLKNKSEFLNYVPVD